MHLEPFIQRLAIKRLEMMRLSRRHRFAEVLEEIGFIDIGKHIDDRSADAFFALPACHSCSGLADVCEPPLGVNHAKTVSDAVQSRLQARERGFPLLLRTPSFGDI